MEQIVNGRELLMAIAGGKIHTFEDILALPEGERAEEYWIVDLKKEQVKVSRFSEDGQGRDYSFEETVKVGIYDDLEFDLRMLKEYLEG